MDSTWWTVLYIAFGVVALWLLGEVLLQYKARLRWRLLAFFGFLGVVAGVLVSSIVVIVAGAVAFGVGQTYVTLSFLRGFSTGWALGGRPGASRRRRTGAAARDQGPTLEVSDLSYEEAQVPPVPQAPPVHELRPLPDDTGEYGVYDVDNPHAHAHEAPPTTGGTDQGDHTGYTGHTDQGDHTGYTGHTDQGDHTGYTGHTDQGDHTGYTGHDNHVGHDNHAGHSDHAGHGDHASPTGQAGYGTGGYAHAYDYGTGDQQQYAAYSDPYIGTTTAPVGQPYGGYDGYGDRQPYADPYAAQYGMDTPPGGVWVPPQREGEQPPPPQEPPSPYGYDQGGQQYRY
ncbi:MULTISPECIES: hypothetical protein [Streptomyces]|uniref:Uncharacterized protein n=2 Tax=Streptomyces TaxID=1883 RepID=A0A117IWM3_9ACTN|nr:MULTISPECIES: hypothetical protein [Streptomyces]KUH39428.1 hypothetical protein ATE80_07610 [Streptomyces kanasensis]UUS30627.1 hypothetical protein NRO40_07145 [Streptomyces changanensis]